MCDFQAQHYRTSHVMVILGSDFMYQNAYTWYTNIDKLIRYINLRVRLLSAREILFCLYFFSVQYVRCM